MPSHCSFRFSSAGSPRLALYEERESCPGQVNSKQLRTAVCTACSVSNSQLAISAAISPSALHTRSHSYASLRFSLSRYLTPLPYPLSLSQSLPHLLPHLSRPDTLSRHIFLSFFRRCACRSSPITSYRTGG